MWTGRTGIFLEKRMRFASPLRYPGGKGGLTDFLVQVIELNDLRGCAYFEPYAGGAGAALGLLRNGVVDRIHINDADLRIYSFWRAALVENQRFVSEIFSVPLTIEEWYKQREVCLRPETYSEFEIGFAAFYMNRCNRSGVLSGAGPIGGYEQSGKWKLGVRFNREALAERLLALVRMSEKIQVTNLDAIAFLKSKLPSGLGRSNAFVYLDPPYVDNGQRLYLNSYSRGDHAMVSKYLDAQSILPWVMSYDDTELIRLLYSRHRVDYLPIRYSLQNKRSTKELFISPHRIALPTNMPDCVNG
jgi:DNA adenine methylase